MAMTPVEERDLRVRLRHENVMLRAERDRLERLLAMTLRVASADGRDCEPLALLEVVGALIGEDLSRPAWTVEHEEHALLALFKPTNAERAQAREVTRAA